MVPRGAWQRPSPNHSGVTVPNQGTEEAPLKSQGGTMRPARQHNSQQDPTARTWEQVGRNHKIRTFEVITEGTQNIKNAML